MKRKITGYRKDEEGHWVAELDCGHTQHLRHSPPWQTREWVTTEAGRQAHIGRLLDCKKCEA